MGIYYEDNKVVIHVYTDEELHNRKQQYIEQLVTAQQEQAIKRKQEYYDNTEVRRKSQRNRINNRLATDNLFKLRHNLRNLIRNSVNRKGFKKESKTSKILGCSYIEFKLHIESQFKDGMSWENYGVWEFDHITPVSWATTEDDIIKLNHYTNFQPLWKEENIKKRNFYSG
jgi:hypothetical protein